MQKKNICRGAVLLAAFAVFVFTGCPNTGSPKKPGDTTRTFTSGPGNFAVQTGDGTGEITFAFTNSNPAADAYTLYWAQGNLDSAEEVISAAHEASPPQSGTFSAGGMGNTRTITAEPDTPYSLVLVASKEGYADMAADVQTATAKAFSLAAGWESGVVNFTVAEGNSPGEVNYSFREAVAEDPAAIIEYTLYYLLGTNKSAAEVKLNGERKYVDPGTGKVEGLTRAEHYSFMLVASIPGSGVEDQPTAVIQAQAADRGGFSAWASLTGGTGDKPGEIVYRFGATTPPADSYTMYWINRAEPSAGEIILADSKVEGLNAGEEYTFEAPALNRQYSFVIAAEKADYRTGYSNIIVVTAANAAFTSPPGNFSARGETNVGGQILFSFTASDPAAQNYRLYYAKGEDLSLAEIRAAAENEEDATAGIYAVSEPGVDLELIVPEMGEQYSLAIAAVRGGYGDSFTHILTVRSGKGFIGGVTFTAMTGLNQGEIMYFFEHTNPPADTYTLYRRIGTAESVQQVPGNIVSGVTGPGEGVINLSPDVIYSFMLVAEKDGFEPAVSPTVAAIARGAAVWNGTLNGFSVETGTSAGDVRYTFQATSVPADSYTMYWILGEETDYTRIMTSGNSRSVVPPSSPQILSLMTNAQYSFVVIARKAGYDDAVSDVVTVRTGATDQAAIGDLRAETGDHRGGIKFSFSPAAGAAGYTAYWIVARDNPGGNNSTTPTTATAVINAVNAGGFPTSQYQQGGKQAVEPGVTEIATNVWRKNASIVIVADGIANQNSNVAANVVTQDCFPLVRLMASGATAITSPKIVSAKAMQQHPYNQSQVPSASARIDNNADGSQNLCFISASEGWNDYLQVEADDGKIYVYYGTGTAPAKYSFKWGDTDNKNEIPWSQFKEWAPTVTATITVTDIPGSVNITQISMSDKAWSESAIASGVFTGSSGTVSLYPGGPSNYYIRLKTWDGKIYRYNGGGNAPASTAITNGMSVPWSQFTYTAPFSVAGTWRNGVNSGVGYKRLVIKPNNSFEGTITISYYITVTVDVSGQFTPLGNDQYRITNIYSPTTIVGISANDIVRDFIGTVITMVFNNSNQFVLSSVNGDVQNYLGDTYNRQ